MDMSAYKEKKQKKSVSLQKLAKNFYQIVAHKYDTDTGQETTPEIASINLQSIEQAIEQADAEIAKIQARKDGLLELKADLQALG